VEEERTHHLLNRCLATRTGIPLTVRELEPAVPTQELVLLFGCDHPLTLSATDEAGEGKLVLRLWSGTPVATEQCLHSVIFCFGDQGLMLALVPAIAAGWVLKPTVVERLREDLVDGAPAQGPAPHLARWPRAESPFLVGDVENLGWGVEPREHEIPHAPDEREALWVFDEGVLASLPVRMVQVACRCHARVPAVLDLGLQSPFHILAQVINVLLGHAELDVHEDDVVIFTRIALGRSRDVDAVLLDGPDDGAAVHRIACQTVEFPADDAGSLTTVETLHHRVEDRSSRVFGGLGFGQNLCHGHIQFVRQLSEFANLRFNGKNLPVFGF
jgi:hypothetical protein